jgi:hypothetical protein
VQDDAEPKLTSTISLMRSVGVWRRYALSNFVADGVRARALGHSLNLRHFRVRLDQDVPAELMVLVPPPIVGARDLPFDRFVDARTLLTRQREDHEG